MRLFGLVERLQELRRLVDLGVETIIDEVAALVLVRVLRRNILVDVGLRCVVPLKLHQHFVAGLDPIVCLMYVQGFRVLSELVTRTDFCLDWGHLTIPRVSRAHTYRGC